jgi:pimeloyl-ACP methyl ester carboxylesterase
MKNMFVDNAGVPLFVEYEGQGPLILCVHGFPEASYSWKHVINGLDKERYTLAYMDMRGYGKSGRPGSSSAYHLDTLASDIAAVVKKFGREKAFLVGHDWGGIVCWRALHLYPDLFSKYIAINAPHPESFRRTLFHSRQTLKSWYIFVFQLPFLMEMLWRFFGKGILEKGYERDFTDKKHARKIAGEHFINLDIKYPLMYYRRAIRDLVFGRMQWSPIDIPVLVLHGTSDRYVTKESVIPPPKLATNILVKEIGKTHWLHYEKPEVLVAEISEFFA